ncbi:unnamed protein product [Knipowitschia caucasica]
MGYGNQNKLDFNEEPQLELDIEHEAAAEELSSEEFCLMVSRMLASLTDLINERFERMELLLQKSTDAIKATLDNIERSKEERSAAKRSKDEKGDEPSLKPARKRRRHKRWRQNIIQ